MAGYNITNSTDKSVHVTIYEPFGTHIGYGDIESGKTRDFTSGFWAIGSTYRLRAEYPAEGPHAWDVDTHQVLRHIDFDSISIVGGPGGGSWQTPG